MTRNNWHSIEWTMLTRMNYLAFYITLIITNTIDHAHQRATVEHSIEIYENCTNIYVTPEVFTVYTSGHKSVNKTCDQMIQTTARNRTITYQIQYKNKEVVNQTIESMITSSAKDGILTMIERANITEGTFKGSLYYAIRYYNNTDFYRCNRDPGLTTLRLIRGQIFFVRASTGVGLFTCHGSGLTKFDPGVLFAYADVGVTRKSRWFEDDSKMLSIDFLPYLYFKRK